MRRGGAKKIGRGRVKLPVQFVTQKFSCIFTDDLFPLCSEQKVTLSMRGRRWLSLLKIAGLLLSSSFPLMASDVNDAHNLLRAFHSSYIVAQLLPKALQVSKKLGRGGIIFPNAELALPPGTKWAQISFMWVKPYFFGRRRTV